MEVHGWKAHVTYLRNQSVQSTLNSWYQPGGGVRDGGAISSTECRRCIYVGCAFLDCSVFVGAGLIYCESTDKAAVKAAYGGLECRNVRRDCPDYIYGISMHIS